MKPVHIPRHIDDPQQFLLWSADEIMPIVLGLLFGMMIGKALICTLIGFVVMHQYRKFRDNHSDGYLQHAAYEWGFMPSSAPKRRTSTWTNAEPSNNRRDASCSPWPPRTAS